MMKRQEASRPLTWWQRPGLGVAYSVESRPGWAWNRNYNKYNKIMMDEDGGLQSVGPYCKVEQFVNLTREVGADYQMLYAKWHDGICFFDSKLTNWKTQEDYMASFSRLSKEAGIPFMIYYSNVFDHNPQFDHIQPWKGSTVSFIRDPEYLEYLKGQFREMVEQYKPDGFWLDWYQPWPYDTVKTSIDFLRENYPEVAIGFNASSKFKSAYDLLDYTTDEIHTLGKPEKGVTGVIESRVFAKIVAFLLFQFAGGAKNWYRINHYRRDFDHFWSAISPAGKFWQDPSLRPDLYNLPRIAATVMACGGRNTIQVNLKMDGHVFDEHVEQMRIVGEWYKPRKHLFNEATPLRYKGATAPGISGLPQGCKTIASQLGNDVLIHIIKVEGSEIPSEILISEHEWTDIKDIYLEPYHQSVPMEKQGGSIILHLEADQIDPVDTILRLAINHD
jgi:alpha-L-fucosidase